MVVRTLKTHMLQCHIVQTSHADYIPCFCFQQGRYKLDAVVGDDTGTMKLMIFAEAAERLIGVTAEDLVEESTGDGRCSVPAAIECIIGSTHTFQVSIDDRGLDFVVKWVLNDDDLALLRRRGSVTEDEAED